jgi:N-acetyl-gamma-glutamyl-phosphate reductase
VTSGKKIRVAVLGATGYAGCELVKILLRHKGVEHLRLLSRAGEVREAGLDHDYPELMGRGDFSFVPYSAEVLTKEKIDLLFLATPHDLSRALVPEAIELGVRIVDLSGAWRLKSEANRRVYKFTDADPAKAAALDAEAVFGLPELHRKEIAKARLVANPGCYATSMIVPLVPLVRSGLVDVENGIICDAKSGVSGAGKKPVQKTHFVEASGNLSAYSVFGHRHTGEVLEQTGLRYEQFTFTPHLLPIPRGILSTIYLRMKRKCSAAEIDAVLHEHYKDGGWVRIFGSSRLPEIRYSVNTNYCDVGFALSEDGRRLTVVSCLDNLLKGAAGQAAQNMNVMYGWSEQEGLR